MNTSKKLRVAIVGASGIGKNHASWFAKNGAEICAFAGSSNESIEATRGVLQSKLDYVPNGYLQLSQLLQSEKPDAVCIASPPHLHFEHTKVCLENGVHTLCEKPLVYYENQTHAALISQAHELSVLAAARGVLLGTQMQYCFLAQKLCEISRVAVEEIEVFKMEMETKNIKPGRSHATIWIELAPHALSVLQMLFPNAKLEMDSIQCEIKERETTAHFQIKRANGSPIKAQILTRYNESTPLPLRRFTINEAIVDYAGRKNDAGEFRTILFHENQETEMPDLVDTLIENFVSACNQQNPLFVTGEIGAKNVEWLLNIFNRGQRV